jgi:hypothetical protein
VTAAAEATTDLVPPKHIEVEGHRIHLRLVQQLIWGIIAADIGAYIISAVYYLVLQAKYGPIWLKPGWDGLLTQPWWDPARHDIRDVYEGALATLLVKSLMANWSKKSRKHAGPLRVATSPLVIFLAALPIVVGGAWLLNVGGPAAWHYFAHHGVLPHRVTVPPQATSWQPEWLATFLQTFNWQPLLIGVLAGQVVHRLYAPVGDTVQLFFIERAIDRTRDTGRVPLWVRYPIAPPVVRERFAWLTAANAKVRDRSTGGNIAILAVTVIFVILALYGAFIRLWFAKHGIPGALF